MDVYMRSVLARLPSDSIAVILGYVFLHFLPLLCTPKEGKCDPDTYIFTGPQVKTDKDRTTLSVVLQ